MGCNCVVIEDQRNGYRLCCWQLMPLPSALRLLSSNTALEVRKIHAESDILLLLAACFRMWKAESGWQGC